MAVLKKKRRVVTRIGVRKAQAKSCVENTPVGAGRAAWGFEALSVFFGVIAVFVLLSILSHQLNRISSTTLYVSGSPSPATNLMGPVGHLLAVTLCGFLGWCSLMVVVWLSAVALYFWSFVEKWGGERPPIGSKALAVFGLVGSLFFCAALAAVLGGDRMGGRVGMAITLPLLKYLNAGGAFLICAAVFLLFVGFATQQSTGRVVRVIMQGSFKLLEFGFITLPLGVVWLMRKVWAFLWRGVVEVGKFAAPSWLEVRFAGKVKEEGTADAVLAKPRLRKNELPYSPLDEFDGEPGRKVVVMRRNNVEAQGKKEIKKQSRDQKQEEGVKDRLPDAKYKPFEISMLSKGEQVAGSEADEELLAKSKLIEDKLRDFGIFGRVTEVHPGPVITLFEFEPAAGVKVGRIAALQDDLSMSLRATSIRIIAPIPKKGTVGIEVPNRQRELVRLRDVLESEAALQAESILNVPIGKDTYGDAVTIDISMMPHLLMAGATGTGKSVLINTLLLSLLYRASPSELGLILIDPKILELSVYEGIPHLMVPVVTSAKQARAVLEWAVKEMNRRYRLMQRFGVRSLDGYNRIAKGEVEAELREQIYKDNLVMLKQEQLLDKGEVPQSEGALAAGQGELICSEEAKPIPKIVIVIDELADLMLSVGREIEELITRLAQKARAAGIHLIVATQRPSVDVITGLIKANFPARISFRVASRIDSRTILDCMGADKLLGRGDMLIRLPGCEHVKRVHGAYVSDTEVQRVVNFIKRQGTPHYDEGILEICEKALEEENDRAAQTGEAGGEHDEFYDRAVQLVMEKGQASTSMIQRAFRIGYNRAARIIEVMEQEGLVGPMEGVKPREVLIRAGTDQDF